MPTETAGSAKVTMTAKEGFFVDEDGAPVVRRYDPDAGEQEGKPAEFTSLLDAAAYAARWL